MLDQNTDRMWFVIGAVIVGAAIIFIANGTMPELFASVADTFGDSTESVTDDIHNEGLKARTFQGPWRAAEITDSTTDGNGTHFTLVLDNRETDVPHSGTKQQTVRMMLKPNTTYEIRYDVQKLSGTLKNIGGHVNRSHTDTVWYVNDQLVTEDYVFTHPVSDTTDTHHVRGVFTTTDISEKTGVQVNRTMHMHQPNKGELDPVTVRISNWTVTEIEQEGE